jgi:TRAP-type C4-dicarboxylate transport system substrate-binding protein
VNKRSWLLIIITGLTVMSLVLGGCTSASTSSPTSTVPAQPAVIKLKWAGFQVPTAAASQEAKMWLDLFNKQANGRVEITYYPAEQLGKAADFVTMLKNGVTDIADIGGSYYPTVFQMTSVTELPLLGIPNTSAALNIRYELYQKGYFDYGLKDLKLLYFSASRPFCLWTTKPILKTGDFAGKNLRGSGRTMTQPFEQFGATSVSLVSSEVAMSLERGVIDGTVTSPDFLLANKWSEMCKYGTPPLLYGGSLVVMSQKAWSSLPADIQLMFLETSNQFNFKAQQYYQDADGKTYDDLAKAGVTISKIDPAEWAKWQTAAQKTIGDWSAAREGEGLPGKQIVEDVQKMAKRYQ